MKKKTSFSSLLFFLTWLVPAVLIAEPLTFDPNNPPTQNSVPTEVYHEYTGTNSWRLGPKTMIVFRVYPSDREPWTNYKSDEDLLSELMTMSENYYRGSFQQTWFGPKRRNGMDIPVLVVTPPMELPGTYEQYRNSFSLLQSHSRAAAEALGPEWRDGGIYDHRHYDRHVAMSNANMVGSAGLAYVNGKFSWVGGSLSGTIAVHELGHNWGLYHANSWYAPDGVDPEVHPRSPLRQNGEYQDGWCVMGGGNPGLMFNPLFRYRLGFLTRDRDEVKDITSSGTYRIYDYQHHDRRQEESKVRVLNIPITSYSAWNNVFLGFGHRSGTDGGWSRTDYNRNAVTVHSMMSSGSNRLDTTPNSLPGNADRDDSSIKIGRTYSEGPNENGAQMFGGFHVTPVLRGSSEINGQTHEWIEVVINYGDDISNNQPPEASFAETVLDGAEPGVPFEITVNASDPDGDDLAFDWDFGDNTYNIVNSATQTKTWDEAGFYFVEVTVSDMKGGLTDASVWVNVGDVPYRTPEEPAATQGGLHYTYYEGSFQQLPNFDTLFPLAEGTVETFSLAPAQRSENFAMVYTGYLEVEETDVYTFSIDAKDGVRFWVGENLVIENDGVKSTSAVSTGNIALQEGFHEVRLEYFHRTGSEKLEVSWSTIDSPLSVIESTSFQQIDWEENTPPTVSVVNPQEGETFLVGADILVTAEASDEDGIDEVRFFANGSFIGVSSEEPFSALWENVSVGTQKIVALAIDHTGRTQLSNVRTITVESPPPTRSVGINFAGTDSWAFPHDPTPVGFADRIGAVYSEPFWNNFTKADDEAQDGIYLDLLDNDGFPTPIWVEWQGHTGSNSGKSATDTSTGNGRMMHGFVNFNNNNQQGPWLIARDIPYAQFDVYVYFDYVNDSSRDASTRQFRITNLEQSADLAPPRFGQNSLDHNNGLGDYPNYETWVGFKESTALSADAPADERLGNYVVFRNITDSEFRMFIQDANGANSGHRFMNGMQIVEVEPTEPGLLLTRPADGWQVQEGEPPVLYGVQLTVPPTAPVTVSIDAGDQLQVSPDTLTFTESNWDTPQLVDLQAIDDDVAEGLHTGTLIHSISGAGDYDGLDDREVVVQIEDNDQPFLSVYAQGEPAEEDEVPGHFHIFRNHPVNLDREVTIEFAMSGEATPGEDYHLSGANLSFSNSNGEGSIVIPAGEISTTITLTPVDDDVEDGNQSAILTLLSGEPDYALKEPATASLKIIDNDKVTYFVQRFAHGLNPSTFNLHNTTVTFTPDGTQNFYRPSIQSATEYPTDPSDHTNLVNESLAAGNHTLRSGFWRLDDYPVSFFGTTYSRIYVSTNGGVTFGSGDTSNFISIVDAFYQRLRVALYWRDLDVGRGGEILIGRVTTPGEERTVVTYDKVHRAFSSDNSQTLEGQIEFWDDGRITFTWLDVDGSLSTPWIGLSQFDNGQQPEGWQVFNFSGIEEGDGDENPNRPPFFVSPSTFTATVGETVSLDVLAADPDMDELTLSAEGLPSWLSFTDHGDGTGTLSGTPDSSAQHHFTLHAYDAELTVDHEVTLNVFAADGNFAEPVFDTLPPTTALVGDEYLYEIAFSDTVGSTLTIEAQDAPGWLTLTDHGDNTATLSGTVPPTKLISVPVKLKISNGVKSTFQNYTVTFERPPEITVHKPWLGAVELPHLDLDVHIDTEVNGQGHPVSISWTQVAGPEGGTATFDDPAIADPMVSFDVPGRYSLQIEVDNGLAVSSKIVEVFADASGQDVLGDGQVGFWRMNDAVGSSELSDSSGNENHATITDNGNIQLGVSGYDGTAVRLGGNGNYATVSMGMPEQMTVSVWMMADASPAQRSGSLLSFIDGNGNQRGNFRMESGDTRLHFDSNHVNSVGRWRFEQDIPSGDWMHVVLTYDSSSNQNHPTVWINGELVETTLLQAPGSFRATSTTRIGSGTSSNTSWNGRIDEMRLYDRIVPPEDIALSGYPGPVNQAPDIQVENQGMSPDQTIQLGAVVTDDGLPNPPGEMEFLWIQEDGPEDSSFGLDTFADTTFTSGPFPAIYDLRLFADDGWALVSRTMQVQSEGGDPMAPEITEQPESLTVTELESASFSVSVNANPAPSFQWRKGGVDIDGANAATFTIESTELDDAGNYDVVITNDEGDATSATATLTVNPIPPEAPVITQQPQSQSALVTQSVTFEVEATGHPAPTFQWRKDGEDLDDETSSSLTLNNLSLEDSGDYDVVVSNSEDTVISDTATLNVAEGPSAPTIITQPQGQTVSEGETVLLEVEASGNPTPEFQWRRNGSPITGADQATYEIASASPSDAGSYDVVVSNSEGTDTSEAAEVEVLFAPVISDQPESVEVTVGEEAVFSVSVEGNPEPTYQWLFNGDPISQETSSTLTLAETGFDDAGNYSVEVSNSEGTVVSSTVSLTVNPGEITIALQRPTVPDVLIPEGVGFVLETEVSEDGGESGQLNLIWSQESGSGSVNWETTDTEETVAWFSEQGSYTLRLTADNGTHSETLDIEVEVVDPALIEGAEEQPMGSPAGSEVVTISGWNISSPAEVAALGTSYQADFADVPDMGNFGGDDDEGMGTYVVVRNGSTWNFAEGEEGSTSGNDFNRYRPGSNSGDGPRIEYDDFLAGGRAIGFARGEGPLYGLRFENTTGETINEVAVAFAAYVERGSDKTYPFRWAVTPASMENPGGDNAESDGPLSAEYRQTFSDLDLVVPADVPSDGWLNANATLEDFEWEPGDTLWLLWESLDGADSPRVYFDTITMTPDYIPTDQNIGPLVNAGEPQTVNSGEEVTLAGSVQDDGLPLEPGTVTTEWIQVSGPASVSFSDAASLTPNFTTETGGEYVFRLIAFDGEIATANDVALTVEGETLSDYEEWLIENDLDGEDEETYTVTKGGREVTLREAYLLGNDPHNPADVLQVRAEANGEPDSMDLRFQSLTGRVYWIEYSDDLATWETYGETLIHGDGEEHSVAVERNSSENPRRFYRIRVGFPE
ncbi:MAG: immunoglobulin domain-containing protein [Opitutales bacterium]|nr:immunoglobulin domain-containing protein [Opitutales bacterium]